MAFEQVSLRYINGQEYGPVPWEQLVQWRMDGRVPNDAFIVDIASGMTQPVMAFPQLAALMPHSLAPTPMLGPAPAVAPSVTDHLIPMKNPPSLVAYYCGIFGIIPCFSVILGPIALIAGIIGLRLARERQVGFAHALTGVILGSLEIFVCVCAIVLDYSHFSSCYTHRDTDDKSIGIGTNLSSRHSGRSTNHVYQNNGMLGHRDVAHHRLLPVCVRRGSENR